MDTINAIFAKPHKITLGEKEYTVSLLTQEIKLAFELAMFSNARTKVLALKEMLNPMEYQAELEIVSHKYHAGDFQADSPKGIQLILMEHGYETLYSLMLGISKEETKELCKDYLTEISNIVKVAILESMPAPKKNEKLPKNKKSHSIVS